LAVTTWTTIWRCASCAARHEIDPAVFDYESPIPLWASGAEACAHGIAEIDDPSEEAVQTVEKLAPVVAARPKRFKASLLNRNAVPLMNARKGDLT
jgi:hypothetical protein